MRDNWVCGVRYIPPPYYCAFDAFHLLYEDGTCVDIDSKVIPEAVRDEAKQHPWSVVRFTGEVVGTMLIQRAQGQ